MHTVRREQFIVRVLRAGSVVPAGMGFTIADRHILTCAHVVNTALGRGQRAQDEPGPEVRIQVDFPMLGDAGGGPSRSCKVLAWAPPPLSGVTGEDIAVLELAGEDMPAGSGAARLSSQVSPGDSDVSVFGYPGTPPRWATGAWTTLRLRGEVGGGALQLDTSSESAIRVQPGYSGSPVVMSDATGDTVLGMLAVASDDSAVRDAYAIPLSRVAAAWPGLSGVTTPPCPYRGLLPFSAADADAGLFVGRDEEVTGLRQMLEAQRLVMVAGPSGVGKSSLVNAGLVAMLRNDGWIADTFRPGRAPVDALALALLRIEQPGEPATLDGLARWAARLRAEGLAHPGEQLALLRGGPVLLCADQLEEVLDPEVCPPEARAEFLDLLLSLPDAPGSGLRVVCTLRADLLSRLLEYPDSGVRLRDRLYTLSPMGRQRLEKVIAEPAATEAVRYEEGLVALIAKDASGVGGLPLLEFALTELWPGQRQRRITFAAYFAVGGVVGALRGYADRVHEELLLRFPPERVRRVLLALVRSHGGAAQATRRIVPRDRLSGDWPIVQALAASRLVVLDVPHAAGDSLGGTSETAELAHEALIREWPTLESWVNEDAEFQRWLAVMEDRAAEGDLLSNARLGEADRWLTERPDEIPEAVRRLIVDSRTEWLIRVQELEEARTRAEAAAREAEARRLAAAAELLQAVRGGSSQVALGLAIESVRSAPTLEGDIAIRNAMRGLAVRRRSLPDSRNGWALDFSADGARVAVGGNDSDIRVMNATTGAELARYDRGGVVNQVAFSLDGNTLAVASGSLAKQACMVFVLDPATGAMLWALGHGEAVLRVAFSRDSTLLAAGSDDGHVFVFEAAVGELLWDIELGGAVRALAFSPDGFRIAVASTAPSESIVRNDPTIVRLVNVRTGAERWQADSAAVLQALAFSPDGRWIVTGDEHGHARVLNAATGDELWQAQVTAGIRSAAFSTDGRRVALGTEGGGAWLLDADSGVELVRARHDNPVRAVRAGPGDLDLTFASVPEERAGNTQVMDATSGAELWRLPGTTAYNVTFSPDGTRLAARGTKQDFWMADAATDAETWRVDLGHHPGGGVFSPDGSTIAVGGGDGGGGSARLLDSATGAERWRLDYPHWVGHLRFSPEGDRLALTCGPDGASSPGVNSARVIDVATGTELWHMDHAGDGNLMRMVEFSPDGRYVATGCGVTTGPSLRMLDAATGAEAWHLELGATTLLHGDKPWLRDPGRDSTYGHMVSELAFSPAGGHMAVTVPGSARREGYAAVLDVATGAEVWRTDFVARRLAYSPDGAWLAVGSSEKDEAPSIRVLDALTGAELSRLGHDKMINTVTFSTDGTRVATASTDQTARVFDVDSGTELSRIEHSAPVAAAEFSPDGRRLVTASDHSTYMWAIDRDLLLRQAEQRLVRNLTADEWRRYFRAEPYRRISAELPDERLNEYARMAQRHWAACLPARYATIDDPDSFFADLGLRVADRITQLTGQLWRGDEAADQADAEGLSIAERVGRARRQAEEIIVAEMVLLDPEPEAENLGD